MSKIWKTPIVIPAWVDVKINDCLITVKGPKWELSYSFPKEVAISQEDSNLIFSLHDELYWNYWWLARSLVNNMVEWVIKWYEIKLLILWVWFSAKVEWKKLLLNLGFSHPVVYDIIDWILITVDKDPKWNPLVVISGIDKQAVWQTAAQIRALKKPEPYKWKWIRYIDEVVKMKAWKTAKK